MNLNEKNILIVSPQSWGNVLLAKHHYAIELAKKGNNVYYLNPVEENKLKLSPRIKFHKIHEYPGLTIINHNLNFPYLIKFHFYILYKFLIKKHIKKIEKDIEKEIGKALDIVWSFDLSNYCCLSFWNKKSFKIYHPVDEPRIPDSWEASKNANAIFSVTSEILNKFKDHQAPKYLVNHGVSEIFINSFSKYQNHHNKIKIGLSGNFTRPDIDYSTLTIIIEQNPNIEFHFWGPDSVNNNNITASVEPIIFEKINNLKKLSNVVFYGTVKQDELAKGLNKMDGLLIIYDIEKDQSKGTNYHKVMEFLSTGRVIISNNISFYNQLPGLIEMINERDNNKNLPDLFKTVISNIQEYNLPDMETLRHGYARENTYSKQIEIIENLISNIS